MKIKLKYKRRLAFYGLITVSLIGLILFIRAYPVSSFDYSITHELQELKNGNFMSLMTFVSLFGNGVMMPLTVVYVSLFFYWTAHRREARYILFVLTADLLNLAVKLIINRPRPTVKDAIVVLQFHQQSFPSGHVVHYVVFFGFLLAVMIMNKKIPHFWRVFVGAWSAFLILTISVSRIYLGAHWATDVIGAYLFGMFYLSILLTFYLKIPEKIEEKIIENIPEKIIEKIIEKVPEKAGETIVEKAPEKIEKKIVEKIVEKIPEKTIEKIIEKHPEKTIEKIIEKHPEKIPEKIEEKVQEKIAEGGNHEP